MNDNNIKISNDRNKNKNKINEKKDEMSSQNKKSKGITFFSVFC